MMETLEPTYGEGGPLVRSDSVSIQWSGLVPQLLLRLDRAATETLGSQLERELREAIRSQRLAPDERLPSSRQLAAELGVSRGLVQECYSQLHAEGFLSTRSGSGTRVAAAAREAPVRAPVTPRVPSVRLAVDFRPGVPDLGSFPRRDWLWAMREVGHTASVEDFAYPERLGARHLRQVLASYLRRVRGAHVDPDQIIVCAGFAQGANLVLRTLARRGTEVLALEDPGEVAFGSVTSRWGMDAVSVPVDDLGIDTAALAQTAARAVVLTPAHQSPTGVVLAPERRQALAAWADERDATIVEDDYDAEFRYDRDPVGALQGLAPDRVALIGTVSKSLAPTLRLGWIVCPPSLVEEVAEAKELDDRGSPGLDQLALATLIESGRYDRHLRHMRTVYAGKRRALIDALARHAPEVRLSGLAAGFHAVARLPDGRDERAVAAAARERAIGLYPVSDLRAGAGDHPPELVLGFGNLSEPAIERGVAAIADLLGTPSR
jgi:GntR family transcriptional regulator / MocR family aminotransferase